MDQKNVFVLFRNGRASALKYKSRIPRTKIMDFKDQNTLIVVKFIAFWPVKSIIFVPGMRDLYHFKAKALPFPKSKITFF